MTKKTRLILHIGTYKTGSTSLQTFFNRNRERNLKQHALYYPPTNHGSEKSPKHRLLTASIQAHRAPNASSSRLPRPEAVIRSLSDDIVRSGAGTALISAEGMSRPDPCFARECAALSAQFDVSVVIFLRRQDRFAESLHNQFIRDRGETRSLDAFLQAKSIRAWLDYRSILRHWEVAFGTDAIDVILFEQATLQHSLVNVLSKSLGLDIAAPKQPLRNVSPGREVVEILRRLNELGALKGMELEKRQQRKHVIRVMRDLGIDGRNTAILGRERRQNLLRHFEEGNAEIATRYLGRSDGVLFHDDTDQGDYPEDDWRMADDEALPHLARIISHLTRPAGRKIAGAAGPNQRGAKRPRKRTPPK